MNSTRALSIFRKEVAHILRDPFTLIMALILPVVLTLIFGIAMEFNVKEVPTAVLDSDRTPASRAWIQSFGSSGYFQLQQVLTPRQGLQAVQSEKARAFLVIPPNFQKNLFSGRGAQSQVLLDGADNSTVGPLASYVAQIQNRAPATLMNAAISSPLELRTRFLFNHELNSRWFVVPGLIAVVMSILSILLTSLTVAREWENGSMELLLSTPVQPSEIIVGKLAPYAILGMGAVGLVYILARLFFGVPFVGSHVVFLAGCLLFLVTYLSQGLLISVLVRKQQIAMQLAMLTGLLPSQLLSGFIFPIESMPKFFQYLTMILPARWFMGIVRGVFLQGSTFWDLRVHFFALFVTAAVMMTVATKKFKRNVEP